MGSGVSFFKLFSSAFAHRRNRNAVSPQPLGKGAENSRPAAAGNPALFRSAVRLRRIGSDCRIRIKKAGQVTVELLLVLPVFMLILFFIMEIGNLAYQTILVHHCAYELARIGSLVAGPNGGGSGGGNELAKMNSTLKDMLPNAILESSRDQRSYGPDPQSAATGNSYISEDLKVTLTYPAKLVFPGSSFFLSDIPRAQCIKRITVTVLMPIEKPFFQ